MKNWEKAMIEYHLRKKYNLTDEKIIIKDNHYFYEGLLLQQIKHRNICIKKCKKTHMKYIKFHHEISL